MLSYIKYFLILCTYFFFIQDTMDLSNPVMCGHSFGGATTLMALATEPKFKLGIVLDGWLFPIR